MTLRLCVAALLFFALPAFAQQPDPLSAPDEKAIMATLDTFYDSLHKLDMEKFGTLFTGDADFVNIVGMHWKGREQIVKAHYAVFSTRYKGVAMHTLSRETGAIAPGVAIIVEKGKIDDFTTSDGVRQTNQQFCMTWVLVQRGERWLIRSGHNTIIDPVAAQHDPGKKP